MCELTKKSRAKSKTGWKVVAVKDGEYYSPAMGCKYPKNGTVTMVKHQNRLTEAFRADILEEGQLGGWDSTSRISGFRKEMVGRTSIFPRKADAEKLRKQCLSKASYPGEGKLEFEIRKAKISEDILLGVYYAGRSVAAGRRIEFLE